MNRLRPKLMLLIVVSLLGSVMNFVSAQDAAETINIIYWQAVSTLNPYLSGGTKDIHAGSLILEPLAFIAPDGNLVPTLAAEVPTLENGGISEDLTSVTWTLKEGVVWSDGTPFTPADVIFTWEYCTTPETGCGAAAFYDGVLSVEAVGDNQVKITFDAPKPFPYLPFVTAQNPILNAAQFADCLGAAAASCTEQNFAPIGTGPYMIASPDDFRVNDVVVYTANPMYRGAAEGKPFFKTVVFKGGGDAESAARAVLETGEADYAWNLQISPAVLNSMAGAGNGQVVVGFAGNIERLIPNFTDDSPDNPNRSVWMPDGANAHPFMSNKTVRQALSMAIDRNIIAAQLYGAGGVAACNIVNGPPMNASPNNDSCLTQDIAGANELLDEAGIVDTDGDGIRELDGVPLSILYQTSTNAVRQSTQALIKEWWAQIGVETELRNIDAGVFFGGDPASPDTYNKAYTDIQMFTSGPESLDSESFLRTWQCSEMPLPENNWLLGNIARYCNPDFDAIITELSQTSGVEARAALVIQANDILVQDYAHIPLIFRGSVSAYANSIEGIEMNGWDSEEWNIADWTRSS